MIIMIRNTQWFLFDIRPQVHCSMQILVIVIVELSWPGFVRSSYCPEPLLH